MILKVMVMAIYCQSQSFDDPQKLDPRLSCDLFDELKNDFDIAPMIGRSRIITYAQRPKRPPQKRKAVVIELHPNVGRKPPNVVSAHQGVRPAVCDFAVVYCTPC